MTTPAIIVEINSLAPSAVIELFEIDFTPIGGTVVYFHAGTNSLRQPIVWNGQEYQPFPVEVTGFEVTGQGQLPRPKLRVSNYLSSITALILELGGDLVGAKVTRRRTLKKYLDAVNFAGGVNPTADPTAAFPEDIFYVDRKSLENREVVEFELASSLDLAGVRLPRRQVIQNLCAFIYRGGECGYTGTDYFDSNDNAVTEASQDVCGKRVSSCKARFGQNAELPFGGFPGVAQF